MKLYLYQIWYDKDTKPDEQSGLLAFDCRDNPEFVKREIAHLIRFYDEIVQHADHDNYFALLSPSFNRKTGLTIDQVKNFLLTNPNKDVYLFNPFPMKVYTDMNVWDNGESHHEGLKELAKLLFDSANIKFDVYAKHRNTIYNAVYCNYWVASKPFLDDFVYFLKKLNETIDNMSDYNKDKYFSHARYHTKASFYPFIFERLISCFLLLNSKYDVKPYILNSNLILFKKKIDKTFYDDGYREYFDKWEKNIDNVNVLEEGYLLVRKILRPDINIFPFRFLNRWADSVLKIINLWRMPKILDKLNQDNDTKK